MDFFAAQVSVNEMPPSSPLPPAEFGGYGRTPATQTRIGARPAAWDCLSRRVHSNSSELRRIYQTPLRFEGKFSEPRLWLLARGKETALQDAYHALLNQRQAQQLPSNTSNENRGQERGGPRRRGVR